MGAIVMGATMDSNLLKAAADAHVKAIVSMDGNLATSKADYTAINAALGRTVASVPESVTMDVYNAFDKLVPKDVPEYMMSRVNEADAKKASCTRGGEHLQIYQFLIQSGVQFFVVHHHIVVQNVASMI